MKPIRAIYTEVDLEEFKKCQSYQDLVQFVRVCGDVVEGKKISEASEPSTVRVTPLLLSISPLIVIM